MSYPDGLKAAERFAAEAILDRPYADPDDDAAIIARAALRLSASFRLDADRLRSAVTNVDHVPPGSGWVEDVAAEYDRLTRES